MSKGRAYRAERTRGYVAASTRAIVSGYARKAFRLEAESHPEGGPVRHLTAEEYYAERMVQLMAKGD